MEHGTRVAKDLGLKSTEIKRLAAQHFFPPQLIDQV